MVVFWDDYRINLNLMPPFVMMALISLSRVLAERYDLPDWKPASTPRVYINNKAWQCDNMDQSQLLSHLRGAAGWIENMASCNTPQGAGCQTLYAGCGGVGVQLCGASGSKPIPCGELGPMILSVIDQCNGSGVAFLDSQHMLSLYNDDSQ